MSPMPRAHPPMLISIAIDFRLADVATRERFHLSEERLTQLYRTARSEVVTEAALIAHLQSHGAVRVGRQRRPEGGRAGGADARPPLDADAQPRGTSCCSRRTRRYGEEAARHVVRIASGLESQVLGDGQILGQLRAAYKRASRGHAAGPVLHRLFETALRAGKRVQTETSLSAGSQLGGRRSGGHGVPALRQPGQNARCVVVGAGKTGTRAAKQLHKLGARDLVIVNRTFERAQRAGGLRRRPRRPDGSGAHRSRHGRRRDHRDGQRRRR